MSWFPGTTKTGRPRPRRKAAARSCCSARPRCVRSPLAMISSGSTRSIRPSRPGPRRGSSWLPKCRSERCRTRIRRPASNGAGFLLRFTVTEPTEIFDDLYLGLRAGGALRKKRRGEPLTSEEEEALGRWQRLARVRKAVALGAFTLGTFGLGFTIGGLIFGRWRRA